MQAEYEKLKKAMEKDEDLLVSKNKYIGMLKS